MIESNNSLTKYLADIRKCKPISRDEEHTLFLKYKENGDEKAREKLITSNMRFVLKVALQFKFSNVPITDLINEGVIGLVTALEKYDQQSGMKFITYAVWWIKAAIQQSITNRGSLIRLPANQYAKIYQEYKNASPSEEIHDEVRKLIELKSAPLSFDSPVNDDTNSTFFEIIPDTNAVDPLVKSERCDVKKLTEDFMKQLPAKEAHVMKEIYGLDGGEPRTFAGIGNEMHVSGARIHCLRDQAIRRIRKYNDKEFLQEKKEAFLAAMDA